MSRTSEVPNPEECATRIHEFTGRIMEPETACKIWASVLQHKWILSEKLGRDVGIKVACLDFIENSDAFGADFREVQNVELLKELGARMLDRSAWDTISESQPPKQIVNKRIILPLTERELAAKHGVTPPKTIIFFGPPGTGKTHFVKAIAGILQWWYIEISPSSLMTEGSERIGANLKRVMEKAGDLDKAVVFIDEFEEIAGNREHASRLDKSITNEFMKQVPLLKKQAGRILLICATNYIRQLDAALLRPGRFDCIIPVGGMDDQGRKTIFEHYLSKTNKGKIDVEKIVSMIPLFTPADIEYLFQKVTQEAFEKEYQLGRDFKLDNEIFINNIGKMRPTLSREIISEFEQDYKDYTRY